MEFLKGGLYQEKNQNQEQSADKFGLQDMQKQILQDTLASPEMIKNLLTEIFAPPLEKIQAQGFDFVAIKNAAFWKLGSSSPAEKMPLQELLTVAYPIIKGVVMNAIKAAVKEELQGQAEQENAILQIENMTDAEFDTFLAHQLENAPIFADMQNEGFSIAVTLQVEGEAKSLFIGFINFKTSEAVPFDIAQMLQSLPPEALQGITNGII